MIRNAEKLSLSFHRNIFPVNFCRRFVVFVDIWKDEKKIPLKSMHVDQVNPFFCFLFAESCKTFFSQLVLFKFF